MTAGTRGLVMEGMSLRRGTIEEQIRYTLRAALLTRKGERPQYPEIGSELFDLLFRPAGSNLVNEIKKRIREAVQTAEPRVQILDVEVASDKLEKSTLHVTIRYEVKESRRAGQLTLAIRP